MKIETPWLKKIKTHYGKCWGKGLVCDDRLRDYFDIPATAKEVQIVGTTYRPLRSREHISVWIDYSRKHWWWGDRFSRRKTLSATMESFLNKSDLTPVNHQHVRPVKLYVRVYYRD